MDGRADKRGRPGDGRERRHADGSRSARTRPI